MQPGFEFCSLCSTKHCCTKNVSDGDLERAAILPGEEVPIATFLNRDADTFSDSNPDRNLRLIRTKQDGGCIFHDAIGRCSIYEFRPLDCQIFPFDITRFEGELWWVCHDNFCRVPIDNMHQTVDKLESSIDEKLVPALEQYGDIEMGLYNSPELKRIRPVNIGGILNNSPYSNELEGGEN